MIEYECPECGEPMESPDLMAGNIEECLECKAQVKVPIPDDPQISPEDQIEGSTDSIWADAESDDGAIGKAVLGLCLVVSGFVAYAGGFAIHVWVTHLAYTHWGTFWAIIAFCAPVFAELVALVACFWYGVWFYVLAAACWVCSMVCAGIAGEDNAGSPKGATAVLILVLLLGGSFGYFAWEYATAPVVITAEMRQELDDTAAAVCFIMISSESGDPLAAAKRPEAKARLRSHLAEYGDDQMATVRQGVDSFLLFFALLYQDMLSQVEKAQAGMSTKFAISAQTEAALEDLPRDMKALWRTDQIEILEKSFTESFEASAGALRADWRDRAKASFDGKWHMYGQVYSDLLGCPMPTPEELTAAGKVD